MPQPITPAQIQMDLVSAGQPGMRRTTAPPGAPALASPEIANPASGVNQPAQNMQIAQGTAAVRNEGAMMQASSDMRRQAGLAQTAAAGEVSKGETYRAHYIGDILDMTNEGAQAMQAMGNRPVAEGVNRAVQTQNAIAARMNPDLGDFAGQQIAS